MGTRDGGGLLPPVHWPLDPPIADPGTRPFKRRRLYDQLVDGLSPVRSAMDCDLVQSVMTGSQRTNTNSAPWTIDQGMIEAAMYKGGAHLLSSSKPPIPSGIFDAMCSTKPAKSKRQVCTAPVKWLCCPHISDDYHLNLMDWGHHDIMALALGEKVHLWDVVDETIFEPLHLDCQYPTSVSWAPDGCEIAVGSSNSTTHLWDLTSYRVLRNMHGVQQSRIGALAWNGPILTTGGRKITTYDMRVENRVFQTKIGHQDEICALKWSASGRHLASAGKDGFIYIWDLSGTSGKWLHRFSGNSDSMKALAWCPQQSNLLASGGGESNRHIVFWDTRTGATFGSLDTGSQVSEILWRSNGKEFLTSHGKPEDQLTLWKYPSKIKLADLTGHSSRVLFMTQSPDKSTVASAAADEHLNIWTCFLSAH